MLSLPPDYLAEIARQIAFLSAFLGGFAATFLATLLAAHSPKRITAWTICSSALAASAFVVSTTVSVMLVVTLHPNAPADITTGQDVVRSRILSTLGFIVGIYALLLGIGLCGWMRSRRVGLVTSVGASVAALVVTWAVGGFG